MTLIAYREHRFAAKSMKIIDLANAIIADYDAQGYNLTLRQLYYQFIARNVFPNSEQSYNRLGETISNARLAGLISWDAITDKTREVRGKNHWNGPNGHESFLADAKRWFNIDMWENQPDYVEVWVEKDALLGVLERPCWELDVPFMSCRGYMSQSEEWAAANRFEEAAHNGRNPILIYLGDHDPSGLDMSRDHTDRMTMFLEQQDVFVDVRRIAMNIDQVKEHKPPPNPTKPKDSRTHDYVKRFGKTCWELDALQPSMIDGLIRTEIDKLRDPVKWADKVDEYNAQAAKLHRTIQLGNAAFREEMEAARANAEQADDE